MGKNRRVRAEDKSPVIHQNKKLEFDIAVKQKHKLNEKQREIVETALKNETKCVMIDGIYGSSKSYLSVYCSLVLLANKKVDEIIYIRNPVESSQTAKVGYLKGDLNDKMSPYSFIFEDKLAELLSDDDIKRLKEDNRFQTMPLGFVRGNSWNCKAIIVDEASSMTWDDLILLLTRCGQRTKIFVIGDSLNQSDIGNKSGFHKLVETFKDAESKENGVHTFELKQLDDIVRSEFVKFVIKKAGILKDPKEARKEPMFPTT